MLLQRVERKPETLSVEVAIVRLGLPGIGPPVDGVLVDPVNKETYFGTQPREMSLKGKTFKFSHYILLVLLIV